MAVVIQEGDEKIAVDLKEDSNLQAKSHGYLMDVKEQSAGRSSAAPNGGDITCHREFHDNISPIQKFGINPLKATAEFLVENPNGVVMTSRPE